MSNHTPGPWRQHSQAPDRIIVNGSCVYRVRDMTVNEDGQYGRPNPADVALMAAAPELLAALRAARDELISLYEQLFPDDESDNETTAAIDAALAAIAKAEGRGE